MCKRNYPDKNEARMGCVRDACKRCLQVKNYASMGCVRETSQITMKPAWDV